MLTPILQWSIEIREHGRAIAVFWGLLILSALVPTFIKSWNGVIPLTDWDQVATCEYNPETNCTEDYVHGRRFSSTFYNK